jgi:uncharacterized protein
MTRSVPSFRDLERAEIEEMLSSHRYGRLAFAFHDRVDIEPIHFVYEPEWIYGRTTPGTKLTVLAHHPWVAFEIDDVHGPFDWRSVVVKGTVYFMESGASGPVDEAYRHTVRMIRRRSPEAFTDNDPVPARTVLFRLHIDEVHGRAASTTIESGTDQARKSAP